MSEVEAMPAKARQVLHAAIVEAEGEPGVYVARASVMQQANISSLGEFLRIAEYLAGLGSIAEGVNDYEFFVLTLEGIAAGARY